MGGGITGDVSGFTSSIYKRGIKFINVPTTLLDTFPKLTKLYKRVDSHPKVQEWISLKYPKKYTS